MKDLDADRELTATPHRKRESRLTNLALNFAQVFIGGDFIKSLNEMRRAQWLTRGELTARNEERLRLLLEHSSKNVPFYRNLYRRLGFAPNELRTLADLSALPVLTKSHYREHPPESFYARNIRPYRRIERTTSGSTGEPFQFCLDRKALPVIFASHLFYDSWFDLHPFDRFVRIMSPPAAGRSLPSETPLGFRLRQAAASGAQRLYENWTEERILLWEINSDRAQHIWRKMERFRPSYIMGYTSTLATIADELMRQELPLTRRVKAVIVIAETLTSLRRRLIEQYFHAPIINRYGLREFGSWCAQSCLESSEEFHLNTELVVCELLRADGSKAAPGEVGRVVLTDLHNYAMPFLRYDTGDLAIAGSAACDCGRGFPLLGQIQGRSQECLQTPSGKQISPAVLGHFLFVYKDHLECVRHYQLIQEAANRARLLIVPSKAWSQQRCERIRRDLISLVGDDMIISVEAVNEIPLEKSGKRPIIKAKERNDLTKA